MESEQAIVVEDKVADDGGLIYEALCDLIQNSVMFGRREIPNFEEFLRGFYLPAHRWLRNFGFIFSAAKVENALRPLAWNLKRFMENSRHV